MIYYDKIFLDELKNKPEFEGLIYETSMGYDSLIRSRILNPKYDSSANLVNDIMLPRIS